MMPVLGGDPSSLSRLRDRLSDESDDLRRLLVTGETVAQPDDELIDIVADLQLADLRDGVVVPRVRVDEWRGLLIARDPGGSTVIERETVLGVNNTTRALAGLTPRRSVERALDIATGPGGLALLLADHAAEVVATDVSERAAAYATFNAQLNDVAIDVRVGDMYAPVEDERPFDLITGNLPFVVSPDTEYQFRDGGRERDQISREAVAGAAERLADNGTAVLMCNWAVPHGEQADDAPFEWVTAPDCSVAVLYHSTETPEDYSARWNSFLLAQNPAAYKSTIDRWNTAFESWGIEGIANGTVVVSKQSEAPHSRRSLRMRSLPTGTGGNQIERILRNGAWLERHGEDAELFQLVPRLVGPHRLHQAMLYNDGWTSEAASMVLADSAGVHGQVEALATHVILRIDGASAIGELVDVASDETGIDVESLREATLTTVRSLVETGCLDIT